MEFRNDTNEVSRDTFRSEKLTRIENNSRIDFSYTLVPSSIRNSVCSECADVGRVVVEIYWWQRRFEYRRCNARRHYVASLFLRTVVLYKFSIYLITLFTTFELRTSCPRVIRIHIYVHEWYLFFYFFLVPSLYISVHLTSLQSEIHDRTSYLRLRELRCARSPKK